MEKMKEIQDNDSIRENPFRMPEGYLEEMENSVMDKISKEEKADGRPSWKRVLRPAFYMAAMFGLIFGIGYGVMALTRTAERMEAAETDFFAGIEEISTEETGFKLASEEDIDSYVNEYITINNITSYLAQE